MIVVGAIGGAACSSRGGGLGVPAPNALARGEPIVIAHRGASGHRPEHTLAAYQLAIEMGADYIEPDLVPTKDGVLVARHDNEIGGTTDVATRFTQRKRTAVIDGASVTGWFTEDLTLAELKTLRARERIPSRAHTWDGVYEVPTFDEILTLVRAQEKATGRTIGVYPETKHPSYFRSLGLPLEDSLLAVLARHGYAGRSDAVFIQSFEVGNLRALRPRTTMRLIQLIDEPAKAPPDLHAAGDKRTVRDLISPAGLAAIATYADGIGVEKHLVVPMDDKGTLGEPTTLVRDAHLAGLLVHIWTLRSDAPFLPAGYNGDAAAEWRQYLDAGVDGIFGDFPDVGRVVVDGRRRR